MIIESKDVQIDGIGFTIRLLPAMQALRLSAKLAPVVATIVAKFAGVIGKLAGGASLDEIEKLDLESMDLDLGKLVEIVESLPGLAECLDPALLEELATAFREHTTVTLTDGRKPELKTPEAFEQVFHGKTLRLYRWILAATLANFSDFFGGALAVRNALKVAARAEGVPSPSTSGISG